MRQGLLTATLILAPAGVLEARTAATTEATAFTAVLAILNGRRHVPGARSRKRLRIPSRSSSIAPSDARMTGGIQNLSIPQGSSGTLEQYLSNEVDLDRMDGTENFMSWTRWTALAVPGCSLLAAVVGGPQHAAAAASGGRIGGGYSSPQRGPSRPSIQQQQQRSEAPSREYSPPRAGRDIYGSGGSRVHITYSGKNSARRGNRVSSSPNIGDVASTAVNAGDIIVMGGVSAGIMAVQRYNRKRFLEDDEGNAPGGSGTGSATTAVAKVQLSLFSDCRGGPGDVLASLERLSQTADVSTPAGLSSLVNEVCLTLFRSERDWIGAAGSVREYRPQGRPSGTGQRDKSNSPRSRAKRDFNRAVTRERSKWERETISNTKDHGFRSSAPPGRRDPDADGTYVVATLMVACAWLRSTPPQPEKRTGTRLWPDSGKRDGDDKDVIFSVVNRKSAVELLEWLGDEAAEGRGENLLDVEVLWTPADPEDSLDRDDLDIKWPELIRL